MAFEHQSAKHFSDMDLSLLADAAGKLADQGRHVEAWLVYELLSEWTPKFGSHIETVREALRRRSEGGAKRASKAKIHSDVSTEIQRRLRVADAVSWLGDESLIDLAFSGVEPKAIPPGIWLSRANALAAAAAPGWWGGWLKRVNQYLEAYALPPLALRPRPAQTSKSIYMNLLSARPAPIDGPLVSVHMSCFNAAETVELAIRSLQAQSYRNFELLVFDDCSSDATAEIVRRLAKEDVRIHLTENVRNSGTYYNRNAALKQARGEFFTVHDSDDFALSHRLAVTVRHLQENEAHIAVVSPWVRVEPQGRFLFKSGWGGVYQHEAVATLMLRTKLVRDRVGYWDSVRFAADTEYFERLKLIYGKQNVPELSVPVALALSAAGSLTTHPVHGLDVNDTEGWSPVRSAYAQAWKKWHRKCVGLAENEANASATLERALYMPFPLATRPFKVPEALLPETQAFSPVPEPTAAHNGASVPRDHIARGNALWRSGNQKGALIEYRKIQPDSPLFSHAKFNIEMIERSLRRNKSEY